MSAIVSTDKQKLDLDFIHQFLTNSYWAKGRTKEEIRISIDNSLSFGIYLDDKQIGFARVVTDYVVFGYIMDVFISKEYRGKGYSKQLMNVIMEHLDLQQIKRWMLMTKDAHGVYRQFGFTTIEDPSLLMSKLTHT